MKDRELTLYTILICLILILGWVFIVFAPLRTQNQRTEGLINRQKNRIETRAAIPDAPEGSETKLQSELQALEIKRLGILDQVEGLEQRFVSLDTVDGVKDLRLQIAKIAETTGLDVVRFGNPRAENAISDSLEALRDLIQEPYGRPVLIMESQGEFAKVAQFIREIGAMDASVSVLWFSVTAPAFRQIGDDLAAANHLTLRMELGL